MTKKKPKENHLQVQEQAKRNVLTGSKIEEFSQVLMHQIANSCWIFQNSNKDDVNQKMIAAFTGLHAIKPQDEVEAMLAAQMIATHNATMECFRRAMLHDQSFAGRDLALKYATKLSRNYSLLMESLDKHRGKTTQQKVTVEHVHVHAGGQAIVGAVNHERGGDKNQKEASIP